MDTSLLELYGKTVGFLGTGSIAQEAAKRLEAFGVKILGFNRSGRPVEYFHQCYSIDMINQYIGQCDFCYRCPYTNETHHLVNESVF